MSIGPAPNLGGGVTINTAAACTIGSIGNGSGGSGGIGIVGPNSAPPFTGNPANNCNLDCSCLQNGNGNGSGSGSCGSGSGGGGNTVFYAPSGAAPQSMGANALLCLATEVSTECGCIPILDLIGNGGNYGHYGQIVQCLQNSPDPCSCLANGLGDGSGVWVWNAPAQAPTALRPILGVAGPGGSSTSSLAQPAIGLQAPPPVPGSSAGNAQGVAVNVSGGFTVLENVPVYCEESGATAYSLCTGFVAFYFTTGGTHHYTTPAGSYESCSGGSPSSYNAGAGTATPGQILTIDVTAA